MQQGVTTEVNGNCGFSPAPLDDVSAETVMRLHGFFGSYVGDLGWDWRSPADYIGRLESQGLSYNVVLLVGHATVRITAMGTRHRPPTPDELARMRELVRSAMQAGYFGMSSGLVTPPSVFADTEELVELARVVAEYGGLYASHIRGEGHSLLRATAEALEIGERAGAPVQISHHKATFRPYWGRMRQAIQLSEWAAGRGQSVGFDVYPYTAGSANLTQIIPDWAHEGGLGELLGRLAEPATRERLRARGGRAGARVGPDLHRLAASHRGSAAPGEIDRRHRRTTRPGAHRSHVRRARRVRGTGSHGPFRHGRRRRALRHAASTQHVRVGWRRPEPHGRAGRRPATPALLRHLPRACLATTCETSGC